MLIVFAGPPCSGKSTLAAELARRRAIPHLEMDRIRLRLMPHARHTRADREVAYRAMHWAAGLLLQAGAAVILDAPYGHSEDREDVMRNGPFFLVQCRVSPDAALARFRMRGADPVRLDLTPERVAELVRDYPYSVHGLLLDTKRMVLGECLGRVERYLASGNPVEPGEWL